MIVIATSRDAECLVSYLMTCGEQLRSCMFVETGFNSKLCTSEETWDSMPENLQVAMKARALGFIDGWMRRP